MLICSKVMRDGYTRADSVTRIFAMHANAVIEIWANDGEFLFKLRDAMANVWERTKGIAKLAKGIGELVRWTNGSIRTRSLRVDARDGDDLNRFMELNALVAEKVQNSIGERYFGNVSTRCQSMFPGVRRSQHLFVSPRNTDKRFLKAEDMVLVYDSVNVKYLGDRKPSIDASVHIYLFNAMAQTNYFIHGHAKVRGAPTTENYYPCGDLRGAYEIYGLIRTQEAHPHCGAINLKRHGFLLYSKTVEGRAELVADLEIEEPN